MFPQLFNEIVIDVFAGAHVHSPTSLTIVSTAAAAPT